jgi:hypothetical protein
MEASIMIDTSLCTQIIPDRLTLQGPDGELGYLIHGYGPAGWVWGKKPDDASAMMVNALLRQLEHILRTDMSDLMLNEKPWPVG